MTNAWIISSQSALGCVEVQAIPASNEPLLHLRSLQVDIKNQDKTALQVAAHQGHMEVVKALLQANGSIEIKDEDGDTALHYTAFG